jgi:DNA polymerase II small subunit
MMRVRILNFLTENGTLIQPEAVDYILAKDEPVHYVEDMMHKMEEAPFIITIEHLRKVEEIARSAIAASQKTQEKALEIVQEEKIQPAHIEPQPDIVKEKVLDGIKEAKLTPKRPKIVCSVQELPEDIHLYLDITGSSTCQGKISDFKLYFNDRLKTIRKFLREKRQMVGYREINRAGKGEGSFKVIGMVSDIRTTKSGNKMVTLEDETGSMNVLLTKETGLVKDLTVLDEVIGLVCTRFKDDRSKGRTGGLFLAQELVRPDIQVNRKRNKCKESIYAAFVSDIHVGSKTFLSEEFSNFLDWLKGNNGKKKDIAKNVKYMIIPGDTVDGIGIYPGQEEELEIGDIYGQYETLAKLLSEVPKEVTVIMLPGNHDAVRPAEPQPTFPEEIRKLFSENVLFVGNPCYFSLCGVEILAYHGRSMDDFIKALPSFDYSKAIKIMTEMLKRRHMVPIYGGRTPIAPEHKDYLVIDRIPDIFVTGHGHATGMGSYHGVTLINASAWQSQTSYQKMHNFMPDPAKVPIYNLHTGKGTIIDFS